MLRSALLSARPGCVRLLAAPSDVAGVTLQQKRTTVVMKQVYPPRLAPKGYLPIVKQKNRILRMVERVHDRKTSDLQCILTDFVDGVGMKGDVVTVKRRLFRNRLYPAGLAIYASPDNLQKLAREKEISVSLRKSWREILVARETEVRGDAEEEKRLGVFGEMTLRQLEGMHLRVPMSGDNDWQLTPRHVRIALRKSGVEAAEECITLPQESITTEGEFTFRITINKVKSVQVKGTILLQYKDPAKYQQHDLPPTWAPSVRTGKRSQDSLSQGRGGEE